MSKMFATRAEAQAWVNACNATRCHCGGSSSLHHPDEQWHQVGCSELERLASRARESSL